MAAGYQGRQLPGNNGSIKAYVTADKYSPEKLVHFTVVPGQPPERRPSPLDLGSSWHQREAANPAEVVSRVVEMVAGATNAEDGDFLRRHHLPRRGRDDVSVGSQKTRVELALVSDREVVLRPKGAVVYNRGAVRVMHVEVPDVEVLDADLLDAGFRGSGLLDAGLLDSGVLGRGVLGRGVLGTGLLDIGRSHWLFPLIGRLP